MFVRETSANGKISFWTIHPEANRYLTLDQVFKVSTVQARDVWLPQFEAAFSQPLKPLVFSCLKSEVEAGRQVGI